MHYFSVALEQNILGYSAVSMIQSNILTLIPNHINNPAKVYSNHASSVSLTSKDCVVIKHNSTGCERSIILAI